MELQNAAYEADLKCAIQVSCGADGGASLAEYSDKNIFWCHYFSLAPTSCIVNDTLVALFISMSTTKATINFFSKFKPVALGYL